MSRLADLIGRLEVLPVDPDGPAAAVEMDYATITEAIAVLRYCDEHHEPTDRTPADPVPAAKVGMAMGPEIRPGKAHSALCIPGHCVPWCGEVTAESGTTTPEWNDGLRDRRSPEAYSAKREETK